MKVIQLNIWQGRLLNEVIKFLQKEDADVVCLQEVYSTPDGPESYDYIRSLEVIQDGLPSYTNVLFDPTYTFAYGDSCARYGNAVLSKEKLTPIDTVFTYGQFHHAATWKDHEPNTRNAQIVSVGHGKNELIIVNHHGYHRKTPMGSDTTIETFQILADRLSEIKEPIIFCGDLNVIKESPAMRVFDSQFEDLTATHDVTDTLTRFGRVSGIPCDHILVTPHIKVSNFEVKEDLVSDHKALIVEFDL